MYFSVSLHKSTDTAFTFDLFFLNLVTQSSLKSTSTFYTEATVTKPTLASMSHFLPVSLKLAHEYRF